MGKEVCGYLSVLIDGWVGGYVVREGGREGDECIHSNMCLRRGVRWCIFLPLSSHILVFFKFYASLFLTSPIAPFAIVLG